MISLPPTVNLHINSTCNYRCEFCYAHFRGHPSGPSAAGWISILEALLEAQVRKVNFAGGEPTLHPHIGELVCAARKLGFVVSLVTNGTRLPRLLESHATDIDLVGLSVDSAREDVNRQLGRGRGNHVEQTLRLARQVHSLGIRLKVNTVVTSLVLTEDMRPLIRELNPERWKIFQVLPIRGENEGVVDRLLVTAEEFAHFIERNRNLGPACRTLVVPEDNSAMTGSYAMIDPAGRFFDNASGELQYSQSILSVGLPTAWGEITFDLGRFEGRGGSYR